jgi:hypothetical protein
MGKPDMPTVSSCLTQKTSSEQLKTLALLRVLLFPEPDNMLRCAFTPPLKPHDHADHKFVHPVSGQYEPLEVVIKSDKRRLPALLDYVRYSDSPAVQAEAIRITAALTGRMANIVDLLLQPPARGVTLTPCLAIIYCETSVLYE